MTTNVIATTDVEKKIDMADVFRLYYRNDLTYEEIAEKYGTSKQNIQQRLARFIKVLPTAEEINTYRQNKSHILEAVELKLIDNLVDPDKIKEASLNNVAYAYQQVARQSLLERGLATERIDSFSVTASLEELSRRKKELMDKVLASIQPVALDTVSTPSIIPDNNDK